MMTGYPGMDQENATLTESLLENLRAAGGRIWMFPGVAACR